MKTEVDVEIINRSSRDLKNARARFGDHDCLWGTVIKAATKGYGFYPHPITSTTELIWDEDGRQRLERIDLSHTYVSGKSGRLTFTIYDDRVDVSFRGKTESKN